MSWLSKIGNALAKVEGVLEEVNPLAALAGGTIKALIPGTKEDKIIDEVTAPGGFLDQGTSLIKLTQSIGVALNLPGDQKLIAAAGPMAQIILQSSTFAGKKIADPDLFKTGAAKIASGLADCMNAVHDDAVTVTPLAK